MGDGSVVIKNYEVWKKYMLEIDPIAERSEDDEIDTSITLFGKRIEISIFAGSISNIRLHYSKVYTEERYDEILVNRGRDCSKVSKMGIIFLY